MNKIQKHIPVETHLALHSYHKLLQPPFLFVTKSESALNLLPSPISYEHLKITSFVFALFFYIMFCK